MVVHPYPPYSGMRKSSRELLEVEPSEVRILSLTTYLVCFPPGTLDVNEVIEELNPLTSWMGKTVTIQFEGLTTEQVPQTVQQAQVTEPPSLEVVAHSIGPI